MIMRPLGESGIEVSVVALGAWAIGGWQWGGNRESDSLDAVHAALDHGINLIDTAPIYGMGRSEEIIGKALKSSSLRQRAVISSKCALVWDDPKEKGVYAFSGNAQGKVDDDDPSRLYHIFRNARPQQIRKGLETSLRLLKTDYIDLFQTHWQDPTTPIEDTMAELMKMKKEGKIRAIGCSNATPEDMERYRAAGQLDTDQEKYNILTRGREQDNLPFCEKNAVAFLAYSPLEQGLLTGAVGPERVFAPGDARGAKPLFNQENRAKVADFLSAVRPVADDYRLTLGQLITAWTLAQPGCTHVLLGARTVRQVIENARGGEITLEDKAVALISNIAAHKLADIAQ